MIISRQNTFKLLNTGLVSLLVLYSLPTYAAIRFSEFRRLGFLPGDDRSQVLDVSADGNVMVGVSYKLGENRDGRAFRYTDTDGMVSLAKESSRAHAVSADGNTILVRKRSVGSHKEEYQYTVSQGLVRLPFQANALSPNASVIVGSTSRPSEAAQYSVSTGLIRLGVVPIPGDYPDSRRSRALDVSSDGNVIVGSSYSEPPIREAFRYSSSDGMVGLGHLGVNIFGYRMSEALAISADGNVIVGSTSIDKGVDAAFRYTLSEGMIELEDLDLVDDDLKQYSQALDVSADGSLIVGFSSFEGNPVGVIWDADENYALTSLDEMKRGIPGMSEWSALYVNAISDDGSTIVGYGRHNGQTEAFVARLKVVPIPTALWLMGTAVFGLLGFRKSG